jgi:hypothetical protein
MLEMQQKWQRENNLQKTKRSLKMLQIQQKWDGKKIPEKP